LNGELETDRKDNLTIIGVTPFVPTSTITATNTKRDGISHAPQVQDKHLISTVKKTMMTIGREGCSGRTNDCLWIKWCNSVACCSKDKKA
jgi:hypothetical protein